MSEFLKNRNMNTLSIHFLYLCLAISVCLIGGCREGNADAEAGKPPSQNVSVRKALEETCQELSEETGRSYTPIIGRYLGSKSITSVTPTHTVYPPHLNHKMVFKAEKEIVVHTDRPLSESEKHFQKVASVLGEEAIKNKKDTSEMYGICAFKNDQGFYFGNVETLSLIGDKSHHLQMTKEQFAFNDYDNHAELAVALKEVLHPGMLQMDAERFLDGSPDKRGGQDSTNNPYFWQSGHLHKIDIKTLKEQTNKIVFYSNGGKQKLMNPTFGGWMVTAFYDEEDRLIQVIVRNEPLFEEGKL